MRTPVKAMIGWFERILDAIEDDKNTKWTQYIEWPTQILKTLQRCLNQKRGLAFGDIYDLLIKDPEAFRQGHPRVLEQHE
jgi:hypothetical protein